MTKQIKSRYRNEITAFEFLRANPDNQAISTKGLIVTTGYEIDLVHDILRANLLCATMRCYGPHV